MLGEIYFVTSSRMNLGKYQPDGVICDLAPHDLSILLYWLDAAGRPGRARPRAASSRRDVPETAFLTLTFAGGTTANVQISWLAPRKVRQMVVVGSQRMVQYDDTAADESVRVYDRGMEFATPANFGEYQLTYRSGDIVVPRVEAAEPLSLELADFAHAIRTGADAALARGSSGSRSWPRSRRPRRRCGATASPSRSTGAGARRRLTRGASEEVPARHLLGDRRDFPGAVERRPMPLIGSGDRKGTDPRGRTPTSGRGRACRSGPKHLVPVAQPPDPVPPRSRRCAAPACIEATIARRAGVRAS